MAKENKGASAQNKKDAAGYWNDLLRKEFLKETDRGAVILSGTLFDIGLESLLRSFFLPIASSTDELFDGSNAPLGNFSSKINMAFRLGLISEKYARDLHLIRRIRNEFAHNVHGCDFEHSSVKARVVELLKSSTIAQRLQNRDELFPIGTRGDFLLISSWMLYSLNNKINSVKHVLPCSLEWGYIEKKADDLGSVNNPK